MSYQVVARRFRPRDFSEVVGQEAVTETLVQGLRTGRIAHAWLFAGPRGVGKTTTARILSRALNCEKGPTDRPCGECPVCRDFLAGRDMDVEEIDGASNRRIEDVRELRERVGYKPVRGAYRIYIIDEVHMLTREAFNALLKTLEEPPAHVVFILATTESHKVPETIRSRCQQLTFRRIDEKDIARRLEQICAREEVPVAPAILREIAALVRGGMRDAESLLERVLTLSRREGEDFGLEDFRRLVGRIGHGRALAVAGRVVEGDMAGLLADVESLVGAGLDESEFLGEVIDALRDLLLLKAAGPETRLLDVTAEERGRLVELAGGIELDALMALLRVGLESRVALREVEDRRIALELALLQMARARELAGLEELLRLVGAGTEGAPSPVPVGGEQGPPLPAPGGESEPDRLRRALVEAFPVSSRILAEAVIEEEGGTLLVRVAGLTRLEADRFRRAENKRKIARLAQDIFGEDRTVKIVPVPGTEPVEPDPAGGGETERVRLIKEQFGGEVVKREQPGLFSREGSEATGEEEEEKDR